MEGQIDDFQNQRREAEYALAKARETLVFSQTGEQRERDRRNQVTNKRVAVRLRLNKAKKDLKEADESLKRKTTGLEYCYYAAKALHRSGMPLYLCSHLCGFLNKAAEEFSEIFWEGRIGVSFAVEDSELTARVINPAGSSKVRGQSPGEGARPGLITAFALREAGAKTNLLILDEPGAGLDDEGQKQFAKGILKLRDSGRYSTILVTTHSQIIRGILEGEATTWKVVKRNRRSRLIVPE